MPRCNSALAVCAATMAYAPIMLYLDAHVLAGWAAQSLLAIPTALLLYWCSKTLPPSERTLPWMCVLVSTGFEMLGSLVWKGYHYRLGNVPLFVPFGHGLIYVFGASLAATPFVRKNVDWCSRAILGVAAIWAIVGVTALPHWTSRVDVHGLVWLPLFAFVLLYGRRRAFFAALFIATSEVEIFGTWFGNWIWAPVTPWFHVTSGNPPSAIAAGYAVIDGSMLYLSSLAAAMVGWWRQTKGAGLARLEGAAMRVAAAVILGCLLASSGARAAQTAPSIASPSVRAKIIAAVENDRRHFGGHTPVPGVLIGVWDSSGRGFTHAFGYADLAKKRPLTTADHFRIGSNTKTFVVSVLLQLIAEKKLSLDDRIGRFNLGIAIPNAATITVRELCNMRSGLYEAYDTPQFAKAMASNDPPNARELVSWAAQQKPYFAPGTRYNYSNTNYLLLGLIIESITKDSVGDQIRKRLLVPFGLTHTSYPQTQAMPAPWAHGYALDKHGDWQDVSGTIPVEVMGSAGEMISDMADISRWVKLYATGKTGGPAGFKPAPECLPFLGNTSFGLALTCSAGWYGYTGGLPGYNTADYYSPGTGVTIVAWVTYHPENPPEGVASDIMRDIARIVTPGHIPFIYTKQQLQQANL